MITSELLYPSNDIIKNWQAFYRQDRNSIECFFVGSSHAFSSFDTNVFESVLGQRSYVLASNSQTVTQAYYNVKEALKYQKPDTIVLEAFSLDNNSNWQNGEETDETYDRDWKKESNIDGMRFGLTKLEAIKSQYTRSNWLYAFLRISRSHGNWKNPGLLMKNWRFLRYEAKDYDGFRPSKTQMTEETMEKYRAMDENQNAFQICEVNQEHFHKLSQLCKSNNIKLVVVMAPMYEEYIRKVNYEGWYRAIRELTDSEDIQYIDCNQAYERIGLTSEDFEDAFSTYIHLNRNGADKVSHYVAERMREL